MAQSNKVLVTGSSELPQEHGAFARDLGRRLMLETSAVLVTGGLKSKGENKLPALDGIVAEAARDALKGDADAISRRIITMLPQTQHDPKTFSRIELGTVIRVPHATRRMRRNAMVIHSDAVVAVGGGDATREVIDLAFIAGKPLIPIPATGRAALQSWTDYRRDLEGRLHPSAAEIADLEDNIILARSVHACLGILRRILRPRCFVAMPFSKHPLPLASKTIETVLDERGYQAVGLENKRFSGNILDEIWDSIHHCAVAIIDLTRHRPNVYYELGIIHTLNKPTILLVHSKDGTIPSNIPFDISVRRILPYRTTKSLREHLEAQLPFIGTRHQSKRGLVKD